MWSGGASARGHSTQGDQQIVILQRLQIWTINLLHHLRLFDSCLVLIFWSYLKVEKETFNFPLEKKSLQHTSSTGFVTLWSSPSCVNRVASHRVRTIHAVQLEVQTACIADHFAAQISAPYCRREGATVGARHVFLSLYADAFLWLWRAAALLLLGIGPVLLIAGRSKVDRCGGQFTVSWFEWRSTRARLFPATGRFLIAIMWIWIRLKTRKYHLKYSCKLAGEQYWQYKYCQYFLL